MTHTSKGQQLKDIKQALRLAREAHQHEVDAYRPELYKPECDRRPKYQLDRLGDLICLLQNILYAAQQASRRVQKRGVAQAQQGLDADMFWDADDPEICQKSINNVVVEVDSYRGLKVGDTVTIQRAKRLPDLEVRITMVPDIEGNGDLEWEELAAQATQGENTNG